MLLVYVKVRVRMILSGWRWWGLMQVSRKWRGINVESWHLHVDSRLTLGATDL